MDVLASTALEDVGLLYGEQDLSSWPLFKGGYINFGYWGCVKESAEPAEKERVRSSARMYDEVAKHLSIKNSDDVLEIGCGIGVGTCQVYKKFSPKSILGIDASNHQISRALKRAKSYKISGNIAFLQEHAETFSNGKRKFNKIFTIEALQHFQSVERFAFEAEKSLVADGILVISTFMFKSHPSDQFFSFFPNFERGVDQIVILDGLVKTLKKKGFQNVQAKSIGDHVWNGFDAWVKQTEFADTWNANWKKAFDMGILDYYILVCKRN